MHSDANEMHTIRRLKFLQSIEADENWFYWMQMMAKWNNFRFEYARKSIIGILKSILIGRNTQWKDSI